MIQPTKGLMRRIDSTPTLSITVPKLQLLRDERLRVAKATPVRKTKAKAKASASGEARKIASAAKLLAQMSPEQLKKLLKETS